MKVRNLPYQFLRGQPLKTSADLLNSGNSLKMAASSTSDLKLYNNMGFVKFETELLPLNPIEAEFGVQHLFRKSNVLISR